MDLRQFFIEFQDYLAPKLDAYEQAIYLYVFRKSRLLGLEDVTIGFKSERTRMACGIGEKGKPMSEGTAYLKLASLQEKKCVSVLQTTHKGRQIRLYLPSEIPGVVVYEELAKEIPLEAMDFFNVPENRELLLQREQFRCFYTLKALTKDNFVVEHVVSRPIGDNSYRNLVAASREANNKKGALTAEDFLRRLFRDGYLNQVDFEERLSKLDQLKAGELIPPLPNRENNGN